MNKCDAYTIYFGEARCLGTKEVEPCSCHGNEADCNFYPEKRKQGSTTCPFCMPSKDNEALNKESALYSGIEMRVVGERHLRARHYGDNNNFDHQDCVQINFCPMCGKDFGI